MVIYLTQNFNTKSILIVALYDHIDTLLEMHFDFEPFLRFPKLENPILENKMVNH